MKKLMFLSVVMMAATSVSAQSTDNKPKEYPGYKLVFHDEFDQDGEPDPNYWTSQQRGATLYHQECMVHEWQPGH